MLTILLTLFGIVSAICGIALPALVEQNGRAVSADLLASLEELARVVDIAYCVGLTGIQKPFTCLSRCSDFVGFELVTTWNTGPLLSDSCGYIALSHEPHEKRIIVAFRGTYSIANTIADLSTSPSEYSPYPADDDSDAIDPLSGSMNEGESMLPQLLKQSSKRAEKSEKCANCTVHSGFMTSWRNTRSTIIPHVEQAFTQYPDYKLILVGHSLGGAVAALAGLELQARGWEPQITTFGEPRIGNAELNSFIDKRFNLNSTGADDALYRRVTHKDDPVPLLPLQEWGYRMHAGEIYISKASLPPGKEDLEHCTGDQDLRCIAGGISASDVHGIETDEDSYNSTELWKIPPRYRLWQLFFAHRDYFWRLGLCIPGGDPWDWNRGRYGPGIAYED